VRDPHPRVEVFPAERQLDLWQLLLKGPDDTPYADGTFVLWIRFPEDFPLEAPEVRFSTPVHHCNINSHGKVCHSIFDRNWVADTTVRQVLDCVYGLLLVPEPDDPLDSVLALQYLSKRDEYNAAAASLTRKHALDAYAATRSKLLGEEQAGSGAADSGGGGGGGSSRSSCDSGHPPHLVCKITCALFDEPVTTQHGHTFSRAALLEMLRRKPACPVTGKPLSVAKSGGSVGEHCIARRGRRLQACSAVVGRGG
jgi:ubiquitin-protein ligase